MDRLLPHPHPGNSRWGWRLAAVRCGAQGPSAANPERPRLYAAGRSCRRTPRERPSSRARGNPSLKTSSPRVVSASRADLPQKGDVLDRVSVKGSPDSRRILGQVGP